MVYFGLFVMFFIAAFADNAFFISAHCLQVMLSKFW